MGRPVTNKQRDRAIVDLVRTGWSQSAVARVFKVSRQRIHQIYQAWDKTQTRRIHASPLPPKR